MKNGWVWVERKSQWQPFTDFREIRKGKNKGAVEVILPARKERKKHGKRLGLGGA